MSLSDHADAAPASAALLPAAPERTNRWLFAGAALLATGLANSGFSVMQATLIYLAAPPAMRSRLYGVLSLCIGSGLLGFINIGMMAEWVGAPTATVISGIEGLVAMALTWRWWSRINPE
jgi:hypothetical protein